MSIINLKEKTIHAKIVYYGTALGGKTTSLKHVHRVIDPEQKIELVSLNTEKDRTLFFDFLPVSIGRIGGFTVRLQGFTVPGQVKYNLTRKYVLTGADAVVLVVDSSPSQLDNNVAALKNLKENLAANGLDYRSIPLVLQYNKRDVPSPVPVEDLEAKLNDRGIPAFETVATEGIGVFEAFIEISKRMMDHIAGKYRSPSDKSSIGRLMERNLSRLLESHCTEDPFPKEEIPAPPVRKEPEKAPEPEVDRRGGLVKINDGNSEEALPFPEELLRKAVDSNIEIARLYSEVNETKNRLGERVRELTTLHEIGKLVTSELDADRLLETVLESATSCLGTEYGSLMLVNRTGDDLVEKVVTGFLRDPLVAASKESGDDPLLKRFVLTGDALFVNEDEEGDILAKVRAQEESIRSLLVAPLLLKDSVIGVIVVYGVKGASEGTRDKLRFLSALASHAAIALENARLVARIESFNRELEQRVRERTAELQKAYEDLKQLDRMKDDFLSSISHELLTPLTSIRSFSEILLDMDEKEARESRSEFLGIVHSASLRLTRRLTDLLDLSRMEAGKVTFHPQPTVLRELLENVLAGMRADFRGRQVSLVVRAQPNLPPARCDPAWVTRVLEALLSNAVKFSEEGSEVAVELTRHPEGVQVRVEDQGSGIAPEFQTAIFERFKQLGDVLTDKPAGVGLGLPLSQLVVSGHGGRIWVESVPGRGASFFFVLPVIGVASSTTRAEMAPPLARK